MNSLTKKAQQRYSKIKVKAIRDKICDKCGKKIYTNHDYIYESWIGDINFIECRSFHTECVISPQ